MEYIFPMSENQEAIVQYNVPIFPCEICCYDLADFIGRMVPWHWQDCVEFLVVLEGELEISMSSDTLRLSGGEGAMINSETLHCIRACREGSNIYRVVVFDPNILAGPYGGVFAGEYVIPLLSNSAIPCIPLRRDTGWQRSILDRLEEIYNINSAHEFGYELLVNAGLCRIWHGIVTAMRGVMQNSSPRKNMDEHRLKIMLDYIRLHFREKLTPSSIAASASISARECFRCFSRVTGQSPTAYLINYRIRAAAEMLLEQKRSITDICYTCGFGSPSYFSKVFKAKMFCTPIEYRHRVFRKNLP